MQETQVWSLGWEDPRRRKWQSTPVFLPGESHGWRSLVGYSPRDHKESDITESLHVTSFFLWRSSIPFVYMCVCAAVNIEVHVSFRIRVFFRYMPRNVISGLYGSSVFWFLRKPPTCFSTVAAPVCLLNSRGGFPFLHTLCSIYYL